jgi:hypothetical protein
MIKLNLPDAMIDTVFAGDFEWRSFHDAVTEAVRDFDRKFTKEQLVVIFKSLPFTDQAEALSWGLSDTCFRDSAFVYIREHGIPSLTEGKE